MRFQRMTGLNADRLSHLVARQGLFTGLPFLLLISQLCLPYSFCEVSQTGTISGTVIDAKTGEPLPGVNVLIKDTVLGSSTNMAGEFRITNLRPGEYTVVASMIGYRIKERENVRVSPDVPVILQFELKESYVEMSPVVVTASRKSKSLAETPNSVSVVSSTDIRKRHSFDVRDALKYAPGVSFIGNQVNIRGTTGFSRGAGSRVLLLTDGVPTMPGDSGDIKWDVVPYMAVEKVEVVKGAASALYGSSAIGGVLNIITKDPSSDPKLSVRTSGGIYDISSLENVSPHDDNLFTDQQDVFFSNTIGDLGFVVSAGRRHSRGYRENGQFLRWNVFGKTNYKFSTSVNLTLTGSYASDDHGEALLWQQYLGEPPQPLRVPVGEEKNTILSTKLFLNTTFSQLLHQNFAHKIRASFYRNRFDNDFVDNQDFSLSKRYRGEYQADVEPSVHHSITFGVDGTYDEVAGSFFGTRDAYILATYLQDEFKISDRFTLSGGVRFDYSNVDSGRTESQVSPKFGLIYRLGETTTLKASVGKGFRAPSIAELFTSTSASGFQVIPNPDIKAESSWSAEVGLNTIIKNHVLLNIAVYQERYFDFINPQFEFEDNRPVIRFRNVQDARIRGIEINVTTSWFNSALNTVVSYIYVDPRDLDTDALLTYRPQHLLTASLTWRPDIFEFGVDFRFASRLKEEQVEVFPEDPRVATKVFDARAGVALRNFTVMLNVENLTQYRYTQVERNLEPLRQFSLTVQRDF
ncbi:TonB-dependent receptor [candidate division KSB1 bacterium]|nr:TonB-dependent receptor [candidate division KSB1 bacterium]NIR71317.1 TonB-dependent receptor [candidate division KSB1 bacterium]NIS24827.1 TonB-dependent receptor [candidate division KSB1 bacterium]NIT71747.1 TonB-dependent receptor [candidate division KSB1 bacterium]NIU25462.1 TonB-dependent receptor [candidate division KSB1 bacterium]